MQGSGIDARGRSIQPNWGTDTRGDYTFVDAIRTASGRPVEPGVSIAVDPALIPLGSWVYLENIGWRRADDTGGRIKGKHIDLFMAVPRDEAVRWGAPKLAVWREKK